MKRLFTTIYVASCLIAPHSFAGSATWSANPISGDWNTAANWTPNTVPNGPADIATFDQSNITAVSISAGTEVNAIIFNPGASAFTMTVPGAVILTLSGDGIINNSGVGQNFVTEATIQFSGNARAGDATTFTNKRRSFNSQTNFFDDSTAGTATFVNEADGHTRFFDRSSAGEGTFVNPDGGGETEFMGDATAADGTFVLNWSETVNGVSFFENSNAGNGNFTLNAPPVGVSVGGVLVFYDTTSAANGIFTVYEDAEVIFASTSTAGNATLIADGGGLVFQNESIGGAARVELIDKGTLDIKHHNLPNITIGSLEGRGFVELGQRNITIGSNNLSTAFSGRVKGYGSLTKVGTGALSLAGESDYSGGTTISAGALLVKTETGSATGRGTVTVRGGIIGGRGIIKRTVTVGNGGGMEALIAPSQGASDPTILTLQDALAFKADGSYTYRLNTNKATADQVITHGVTIESGAQFNFETVANNKLTTGTVFTALSNTATTPIAGTFGNLADGATVTLGRNKLLVSYSGGDGNDLTLTVVP